MTRDAFLARLRDGLRGLPPQTVADIVADYEAHFTEGAAAGRAEVDIAQALGDPDRLARELRAERALGRWEENRNPSAAAGAVFAVLGLGAIDLLVLLPVMITVVSTLFGLFVAVLAVFFAKSRLFSGSLASTWVSISSNWSFCSFTRSASSLAPTARYTSPR